MNAVKAIKENTNTRTVLHKQKKILKSIKQRQ